MRIVMLRTDQRGRPCRGQEAKGRRLPRKLHLRLLQLWKSSSRMPTSVKSVPRRTTAACSVAGRKRCERAAAATWRTQLTRLRSCLALRISSSSYKSSRQRTSALISLLYSILWKGKLRGVGIGWSQLLRFEIEAEDSDSDKAWLRLDVAISNERYPIDTIYSNHLHSVGRPKVSASSSQSIAMSVPMSANQSLLTSGSGMTDP
jgi:hypothetical protein